MYANREIEEQKSSSDSGFDVKHPPQDNQQTRMAGLLFLCCIATSLAVIVAYLVHPSFIRSITNETADLVMVWKKSTPVSGKVLIVDLDEKSLARYGQWPWPRYRLSQLLRTIAKSGAASIGLDMILAESDRTSPRNLQPAVGRELGYPIDLSGMSTHITDYDHLLADTLAKGPFVLGYEFLFENSIDRSASCNLHPLKVVRITRPGADAPRQTQFKASGVVCNLQLFSDAVSYSGFLNASPDADGILRRIPQLIRFGDRLFPSLTLAMLMQSIGAGQLEIVQRSNGLQELAVGKRKIPVDPHGEMQVDFGSKSSSMPRISAGDILAGSISPERFKDKLVLVGSSASGLEHSFQTPASPVHSDVDIHARLLDNMITGRLVIRTQEFLIWEAVAGFILALLLCFAIVRMEILSSALFGGGTLAAVWGGSVALYQASGYLISPFLPSVLVILNYTLLTILKTWKNQIAAREKADDTLILLKSSEKNLDSIIKAVPDIIFRLDAAGRITFISPAISKYITTPEKLIGQPIFDLVAPDDLPKARYRLNEKRTGERATNGLEIRLLLPHRQEDHTEEVGYFSISAEGIYKTDTPCSNGFVGTQGIIRDITEQKKLEDRLLHAQKMETIGNLAAGVAHDLNNVLAGLVTYPELLLLELPEDSPIRSKLSVIQKSGQKAAAIVQDLLALARRGVKNTEIVNLNSIISDFLSSPECAATRKYYPDIIIETDLAADLMNVKGSKIHLSKAVMNILNNAVEAMPSGGTIRMSSRNRYLDTSLHGYEDIPAGEYVTFTVVDEGVGIARDDMAKIFEPFYSKKTMKRSGSGLGMTVIWATVKDHDGYIDVQSKEGDGTQIVIYLPVTREIEEANPRRIGIEEYLGTERVLIVDDMPEQQHIAENMLAKLGYRVASVDSGEAAVEYLLKNEVDLIVLDMIMPGGMDGLETFRRIVEIRPGQKAVITSGFSESERVKSLQQLGAGKYIQKPYSLERLGIAVRKELDR